MAFAVNEVKVEVMHRTSRTPRCALGTVEVSSA